VVPYPGAIRAQLGSPPNLHLAKQLTRNFEPTTRGFVSDHGKLTSRAQGILAGAAGREGEASAILEGLTMSVRDRLKSIEAKLEKSEESLKDVYKWTEAEAEAEMKRIKSSGGAFKGEESWKRQNGALSDAKRAELQAAYIAPIARLREESEAANPNLAAMRERAVQIAGALRDFATGSNASQRIAPALATGVQNMAEASRIIDAAVSPQEASIRTLRQLLSEVEADLHALLGLPRKPDPEDIGDPNPPQPTNLSPRGLPQNPPRTQLIPD
jgi:hypothetical protein